MLAAVDAAREGGLTTWALTGPARQPARAALPTTPSASTPADTATIQEIHLVAIHLLCAAVDEALPAARRRSASPEVRA